MEKKKIINLSKVTNIYDKNKICEEEKGSFVSFITAPQPDVG